MKTTLAPSVRERGSVLIIVLWISFGLVSLALYFAHSMSFELRSADNRLAAREAAHAIAGTACYVSNLLATAEEPGVMPDPLTYVAEEIPVGEATTWLIGRDPAATLPEEPYFALADEASKLNLNTATAAMLQLLPRMTAELAAAIVDWRDSDSTVSDGGAEEDTYARLNPAYHCKNAAFESAEELRLVYGMTLEILYGEDTNLNGVLDPNENDGDVSPPSDNRDGRLDPGLLEYLTVWTREPTTASDGSSRIDITSTNLQSLSTLLGEQLDTQRANAVMAQLRNATGIRSVLEFYLRSGMSQDEFALIEGNLVAGTNTVGLVNVNTASEAVLACIPGIGTDMAPLLVSARQGNTAYSDSIAWVSTVLDQDTAVQAGPYLTGRSYQFTADIAGLGHHGRGYQRVRHVLDAADGSPQLVRRQDLTHLGWALGQEVRRTLVQARRNAQPAFQTAGRLTTQ